MTSAFSAIVVLHAACALVYALLAVLILTRSQLSRTGAWMALACIVTAAWALCQAIAWQTSAAQLGGWTEITQSTAWYAFILHLYRRTIQKADQATRAFTTMGLLALIVVCGTPLLEVLSGNPGSGLRSLSIAVHLGIAVCNILLLENLYFNTPAESRWHINLLCIALGGLSIYDLLLYADAVLFRQLSIDLLTARAPITIMAAPLLAVAAVRNRRWAIDIHVSRDVVFHSFTLIVSGVFLVAVAVIGEAFRRGGNQWGQVVEISLIFGATLTIGVLVTSGSARSRVKSLVLENFYSNRYDYRKEWMRCIDALTAPDAFVALPKRAIRAAAEVVDSPAGTLFVRAPQDVAFEWAGSWNMPAVTAPVPPGHPLVEQFREGDWIVRLDTAEGRQLAVAELPRAWLAVPLNHFGTLIGFVVLARSRARFKLDREAFDLLRVVGREIASRVAEQRATQVLTQTQQLRDYSQRFAFVIHDIKNVSGQLSMLLTNAEVHADNPEFQRDMLATVRASVGKISRLLSRLQVDRQERDHALITPGIRLQELISQRRETLDMSLALEDHSNGAGAAIDPDTFDAIANHLLDNAIEASQAGSRILMHLHVEALTLIADIVDEGPGMTPEFVRDSLFRPFRTTKGGHGIGAYQSRELLRNAGGDLQVVSRPGVGTTMRIIMPAVPPRVADSLRAEA
jgi:putative PEP-CTERM system histidine kinase